LDLSGNNILIPVPVPGQKRKWHRLPALNAKFLAGLCGPLFSELWQSLVNPQQVFWQDVAQWRAWLVLQAIATRPSRAAGI
jgi:hypothetical protein